MSTDSLVYYNLDKPGLSGMPAFTFMHHIVGMVQTNTANGEESSNLIPVSEIEELSNKQQRQATSVYELENQKQQGLSII